VDRLALTHIKRMEERRRSARRTEPRLMPPGVKRYTFSPDAAYAKELKALADPNEVPEPRYGACSEMPDGIQYFEVSAGEGRKVLFVRVGRASRCLTSRHCGWS